MLTSYYEHRGWSNEGIPKEKTLKDVGLQDIADDLKKRKVIKA
jgi:aldehyde:ferredoxin oxidoreductase